jgi:transcriptional regulator with XRE-family HTH domain
VHAEDSADETAGQQEWDEDVWEIVRTVGRLVRLCRERAGLTPGELEARTGCEADLVDAVENGRRVPAAEFLADADRVLDAGGVLAALREDVLRARYPRKVRDLARLEAEAVEIGAYNTHHIQGLLQTEDYARALFRMRRPALDEDTIERHVAARMGRQRIFERSPAPILTFVQEEVTLRRPIGGRMVLRAQLDRLLDVGRLRHAEIQVMPTATEDHAGMGGDILLLEGVRGPKVAWLETQQYSRVASDRRTVRTLEAQYGVIRSQALPPRESLAYIEKLRGEIT